MLAALSIDTASSAKCSCSVPSGATGPVIGPSNPIDATHDFVLADALPLLALLLALLLLLLQPATASEPSAAATRTRRPFTGYASISGMSHYVGFPIERTACRLMACRHIGRFLRDRKLNTPSPMGRFRTADQTTAVYAKARGLV